MQVRVSREEARVVSFAAWQGKSESTMTAMSICGHWCNVFVRKWFIIDVVVRLKKAVQHVSFIILEITFAVISASNASLVYSNNHVALPSVFVTPCCVCFGSIELLLLLSSPMSSLLIVLADAQCPPKLLALVYLGLCQLMYLV